MTDSFYNLADRVRKYFSFSRIEIRNLIISILILGFIVGFDDGNKEGSTIFWVFNLINSILIVSLAFIVHETGHRLAGLSAGYSVEYKVWWYGLLAGLILSIISQGKLWILMPGGYACDMLQRARLGKFRYGINYFPMGLIGFMGGMFNILLAAIFKFLTYIPYFADNPLIQKAILINVAYAIYSLLPIPSLDGANLLFASRLAYVPLYSGILVSGFLLIYASIFIAFIGGILAFVLAGVLWYFLYESSSWGEGDV